MILPTKVQKRSSSKILQLMYCSIVTSIVEMFTTVSSKTNCKTASPTFTSRDDRTSNNSGETAKYRVRRKAPATTCVFAPFGKIYFLSVGVSTSAIKDKRKELHTSPLMCVMFSVRASETISSYIFGYSYTMTWN